jgi:hypothetical protein
MPVMRTVGLNGAWLLKETHIVKGGIQDVLEDQDKDTNWMKARVPGVVHLDLVRSEKIPHPYYGLDELDVARAISECERCDQTDR